MTAFSRLVRVLLLLETAILLSAGSFFAVQAEALPHGGAWPLWMGSSLLAGVVTFGVYLRFRRLSARLVGARLFKLGVDAIPRKEGHTYLGDGFVWGPAQTELLLGFSAQGLELSARARDEIAGDWLIHGIGADRVGPLFLPDSLLNQHVFLMGAPGSGKTRGLELLIEQAVRRGDAVVVIDPKGDEGLLDRTYDSAVSHGRKAQFRVLALPYPYQSARYNPLQSFITPADVADRVCSIMPRRGDSEAFRNFAWRFVSIVATGIHRLGETVSLAKLENYCFHNTWQLVQRLLEKLCPQIPRSPDIHLFVNSYRQYCSQEKKTFIEIDQAISMASMGEEYFGKIAGSLRTVLAKLTSESVGYLLSPEDVPLPERLRGRDAPPTLSWQAIDTEGLVVYFFLGSLIGPDSASATARMCLADLMGYIGRKYAFDDAAGFANQRLTVLVDEVADALAPESVNILNKARGAGLSIVMAGQSLADLEVALGSAADARRALANVGSFLTLRAANPDDARFFTEKVGVRPLPSVTRGENYAPDLFATDTKGPSDFAYRSSVSTTLKSELLLPTSALDRLARFHFFGLWAGELRKGMLPLLDPPRHLYSPILKSWMPMEAVSKDQRSSPTPTFAAPEANGGAGAGSRSTSGEAPPP
ncbi:MAG TPA: type IV secretion system DNA-binding domain-containing protein [Planctomycetota bacterium]|nr:type IV secretion system DNA-binding domain-containing protein [Planctomycetota bacterium]